MALHLRLRVADGLCRAALADAPAFILATTRLDNLPAIEALRKQPFDAGLHLFNALGGMALWQRLEQTPDRTLLLECDDEAGGIAWEYAALPERRLLICDAGLLRLVPGAPAAPPPVPAGPPRLLLLHADPLVYEGGALPAFALDFDSELGELRRELGELECNLSVRRLPPTSRHLTNAMVNGTALLHLSCHGRLIQVNGTPDVVLALEDENGKEALMLGRDLLAALPQGRLRAVLLSACQSAPLARELVRRGVPLAIGMHHNFPDPQSGALAATFWRWLAAGNSPAEAARQARRALAEQDAGAAGLLAVYTGPDAWTPLELREGRPDLRLELPGQPRLPENVIPPSSGLLGRNAELAALAQAFSDKALVVTLSGAGGMGKTALAAAFVRRFGWRFGRVLGVSFANSPVAADLVCRSLLEAAGYGQTVQAVLSGQGNHNALLAELRQRLHERKVQAARLGYNADPAITNEIAELERQIEALAGPDLAAQTSAQLRALLREALRPDDLVLLDNYESVLTPDPGHEAAAAEVARLLPLIRDSGAQLLLISRARPAGLSSEVLVPAKDGLAGLLPADGAALFLRYASRSRDGQDDAADWALAREVAALTGGYPLALTLLGSAYDLRGAMPREQFLRDWTPLLNQASQAYSDPRHASFSATVELSLRPLDPTLHERLLALSVYELPFFAQAAALLWQLPQDEDGDPTEAALAKTNSALAELTRRSLLEVEGYFEGTNTPALYRFQPALRQELRRRAGGESTLPPGALAYGVWLARIAYGAINHSPALARLVSQSLPLVDAATPALAGEARLQHIRNVAWLRQQFGELQTARQALEAVLPETTDQSKLKSLILYDLAGIEQVQGDLNQALTHYQESLTIHEVLGNEHNKGGTLHAIASIYRLQGDLPQAMQLYQHSLRIAEALGDVGGKAATLHEMASLYRLQGDLPQAMRLYQHSLAVAETLGDMGGKAATLHEIASLYRLQGDLPQAMRLYQHSLAIKEVLGDVRGKAATLHEIASLYRLQGDLPQAMRLYQHSLAIKEVLGDVRGKAATLHAMANLYRLQGNLPQAMRLYQDSLAIRKALQDVQGKAVTLHQMANVLMIQQQWVDAQTLLMEARVLTQQLGDLENNAFITVKLGQITAAQDNQNTALEHYREGLTVFERLGMQREAGQVRELIDQAKAALREAQIRAWVHSGAPDEQRIPALLALLKSITKAVVAAQQAGDSRAVAELADALVPLRAALRDWPAASGLPPFGVLLGCFQALLRGQDAQLARLRTQLDEGLAGALAQVEQAGEEAG